MSAGSKFTKLMWLMRHKLPRRAFLSQRVAVGSEHLEAVTFCKPATVLDVGANKGQFSLLARELWPNVVVHAFEPLPSAAETFRRVFAGAPAVTLHRGAIGAENRTATFFVADRTDSSSLLKPGAGQKSAFNVAAAEAIEVEVSPLEDFVDLAALPHPIMMKIDVQGAELEVLRGIRNLEQIDYIYVELSFVELYEGQALFEDVRSHLAERGFSIRGAYNQASTPQFGPTQADFLFSRS